MLVINPLQKNPAKRVILVRDWDVKSRMCCAFTPQSINTQLMKEIRQQEKGKSK